MSSISSVRSSERHGLVPVVFTFLSKCDADMRAKIRQLTLSGYLIQEKFDFSHNGRQDLVKRLIGIAALGGALLLFYAFGVRSFFFILEGQPITQSTGLVRVLARGLLSAMVIMLLCFAYLTWRWLEAVDWVCLDLFENRFKSRKPR
jgi:hypothetical protein